MIDPAANSTLAYALDKVSGHFFKVMYFDLSRYLIAAGVLAALLWVFKTWAGNRRIQKKQPKFTDYRREVLSSIRTVMVYAGVTLAILFGREIGLINLKLESFSLFTLAWQVVLMVLLHDAYFYWIHRWMHTKRMFRATHQHHHKSRTPTPWTSYSFTIWEAAVEVAFVPLFLIATSLLGLSYAGLAIFIFVWHQMVRNVMAHAGHELFPAGWVDNPLTDWISTTTHHDLHHSDRHNFGFYFTWWDRMMGTEHPRYKQEFRKNAKPFIMLGGAKPAAVSEQA